jgi:hypothetical protein
MSISQFVNQHSYLMISAAALVIFGGVLRARQARRGWLLWGALAAVAAAGWLALRTPDGRQLNTAADYEAALRAGRPTLVEFYSNY